MNTPAMLSRTAFPVLVVAGPERQQLVGETLRRIAAELGALGHIVVSSATATDAAALVTSDPSFGCILLDWNLGYDGCGRPAEEILNVARRRHSALPVFLMVERDEKLADGHAQSGAGSAEAHEVGELEG